MRYLINNCPLIILGSVVLLLSGCHSLTSKIDTTFLPPENGRTVKISVDVPDMAELLPMKVMYRQIFAKKHIIIMKYLNIQYPVLIVR